MAFSPVAFIAPNYRDYKNYWLKFYEPGTTTPKAISLDGEGLTQVAKLQLNIDGFVVSAGGAIVIPYVDSSYDGYLFPTEEEADNNDTINAIRVADDITGVNGAILANSVVTKFDTLQDAIDEESALLIYEGAALNLAGRNSKGDGGGAMWDAYPEGTFPVGEDIYDVYDHNTLPLQLKLRHSKPAFLPQWGLNQSALEAALKEVSECDLSGYEVELTSDFVMPVASTIRNGTIKLNPSVNFRGDAVCQLIDLDIDANGADHGIQEVVTAGVTTGMKNGLISNVRILNAAISDLKLEGYHFLLKIDRLLCYSSGASGWGIDIGNVDGTLNPDIKITNTYVNGADFGMRLRDGSFHVTSSSADGTIAPIEANNAFIVFDSCGFEQFSRVSSVGSSQVILNQCTMSSRSGAYEASDGQRSFLLSSGGTIAASIEINGGIYQNNSDDIVYLIRGLISNISKTLKIGRDVERRPTGNELRSFIYGSTGTPQIGVAKICHLGDRNTVAVFGGKDPTGSTIFPIEVAKDTVEYCPASIGTVRYAIWREIGSVAGATTSVDFVIYNSDRTERLRIPSAISVPGIANGSPRRFGGVIIDEAVSVDEFVQWEISAGGGRVTTGFSISMVIDE